jgi:hypothetical protein
MVVEFINGWKHGFYFKNATEPEINLIYEEINDLIECKQIVIQSNVHYRDMMMNTKTRWHDG